MLHCTSRRVQPVLREHARVPCSREETALVLEPLGLDHPRAATAVSSEAHPTSSESLRHVNASAYPLGEAASMPRTRISPRNSSSSNQCLSRWLGKASMISRAFSRASSFDTGTNTFGAPRSPSYFGISYSRIEMVAPCVPGQLADEPVILMQVVAGVREDHVRIEPRLQLLEDVLDLPTDVGEVAVAEPVDVDVGDRRARGSVSALARASSLRSPVRAEHDPRDLELRAAPA